MVKRSGTFLSLAAAVLFATGMCAAQAYAQGAPEVEEKPLPHATPLPPPDSLKPGAPIDAAEDRINLPQDKPLSLGGLTVLCTGTGSSKETVDWQSYPVRVEFSNGAAQYLSGMDVTLRDRSGIVASFTCWAPWVLFKAPAGATYNITASLSGRADSPVKSASFAVPSSGQKRVVIAFPEIPANE